MNHSALKETEDTQLVVLIRAWDWKVRVKSKKRGRLWDIYMGHYWDNREM